MNVMPGCCLTNCLIFGPVWVLVLVYLWKLYYWGVCVQCIHCIKALVWTIWSFICFVIFCCLWSIRGRHCFIFCGLLHCLLKVNPKTILKWSCNFVEWSGKSQGILFFIFCGKPEKSLGVNFLPVVSPCM